MGLNFRNWCVGYEPGINELDVIFMPQNEDKYKEINCGFDVEHSERQIDEICDFFNLVNSSSRNDLVFMIKNALKQSTKYQDREKFDIHRESIESDNNLDDIVVNEIQKVKSSCDEIWITVEKLDAELKKDGISFGTGLIDFLRKHNDKFLVTKSRNTDVFIVTECLKCTRQAN